MWAATSRYIPTISASGVFGYDSGDAVTITKEFANIKAAGIDYLILDDTNTIYGSSTNVISKPWIQSNIKKMFEVDANLPADRQIPMAVAIGGQLMLKQSITMQNQEAVYVSQNFVAPWPNIYYKWLGVPLLINYNVFSQGSSTFDPTWPGSASIYFNVRNAADFVNPAQYALGNTSVPAHGWWGWTQDYPQPLNSEAMTVSPGADNAHRTALGGCGSYTCDFHLDRQDGLLYIYEWLRAIKQNPQTIVIASWNEFGDETAVESALPNPNTPNPPGAPPWPTADWYVQITTAYTNLRTGLMSGVYYQDEKGSSIYLVQNGRLVCQPMKPSGHPVILLPQGLIAELGAPPCAAPSSSTPSSLVAVAKGSYTGFSNCFPNNNSDSILQNTYYYKTVYDSGLGRNINLRAHVQYPPGYNYSSGQRLPAIAFFHGGGWAEGNPVYWFPPALYFASRGAITVSFQYRLTNWSKSITPAEAAKDGISAVRWMRKYATALGIDPNKIATVGDSAGGHVALSATLLAKSLSDETGLDSQIPTNVSVAIGLYPLVNTSVPSVSTSTSNINTYFVLPNALSFSPLAHIADFSAQDLPSIHILQGTADTFYMTSYAGGYSQDFCNAANSLRAGSCSVSLFPNEGHGFLNDSSGVTPEAYADINQTLARAGILGYAALASLLQFAQNASPVCRTDLMFANGNLIMNWPPEYGYSTGVGNTYILSPSTDAQ